MPKSTSLPRPTRPADQRAANTRRVNQMSAARRQRPANQVAHRSPALARSHVRRIARPLHAGARVFVVVRNGCVVDVIGGDTGRIGKASISGRSVWNASTGHGGAGGLTPLPSVSNANSSPAGSPSSGAASNPPRSCSIISAPLNCSLSRTPAGARSKVVLGDPSAADRAAATKSPMSLTSAERPANRRRRVRCRGSGRASGALACR